MDDRRRNAIDLNLGTRCGHRRPPGTTEHLAIRLGHALEKAYDGPVLYGISHETKLAHVWWHRDA